MALWRLYYHLVWTTKNRYPYLTLDKQKRIYPYIINKAIALDSIIHSIGGIEDHVHLITSIPPKLSIADFVKNIKGSSAHFYNKIFADEAKFSWQEGYGVFSLGGKQLETAVNYVNNQKEHHRNQTAIVSLEEINHQNDPPSKYPTI